MRDSRPKLLDALFDEILTLNKAPLNNVQWHARKLFQLNCAVKKLLPDQLRTWCRVANFRQGILVLEAANASWMMCLRHEQSALQSTLREKILPSLSSINIKINPSLMANSTYQIQRFQKTVVPTSSTSIPKSRRSRTE